MDRSAILPDGTTFDFWEQECHYDRELIVDGASPNASDDNDGSADRPLRTIGRAAQLATPGTRVRIASTRACTGSACPRPGAARARSA